MIEPLRCCGHPMQTTPRARVWSCLGCGRSVSWQQRVARLIVPGPTFVGAVVYVTPHEFLLVEV